MAAEAVLRIRDAEAKGKEVVARAVEQAKQITGEASKTAKEREAEILAEAKRLRAERIDDAKAKAEKDSEGIVLRGRADRDSFLSPEPDKREKVINYIIERIVLGNGSR